MLSSLKSLLGSKEEPTVHSVTFTGVRFPTNGSGPNLISLTTIADSNNVDCFLFHVPDLRQYWKTEDGWNWRDIARHELKNQRRPSCNGIYYVFYSFAMDDLPENKHIPSWIGGEERHVWYGDVFIVKMAPSEVDEHGWAAYEDIGPEFLQLMADGGPS